MSAATPETWCQLFVSRGAALTATRCQHDLIPISVLSSLTVLIPSKTRGSGGPVAAGSPFVAMAAARQASMAETHWTYLTLKTRAKFGHHTAEQARHRPHNERGTVALRRWCNQERERRKQKEGLRKKDRTFLLDVVGTAAIADRVEEPWQKRGENRESGINIGLHAAVSTRYACAPSRVCNTRCVVSHPCS